MESPSTLDMVFDLTVQSLGLNNLLRCVVHKRSKDFDQLQNFLIESPEIFKNLYNCAKLQDQDHSSCYWIDLLAGRRGPLEKYYHAARVLLLAAESQNEEDVVWQEEYVREILHAAGSFDLGWDELFKKYAHEALIKVIEQGHLQKVLIPLEHGAKYEDRTILVAVYRGRMDVVRVLLEKGANANARGGALGNALQLASARGFYDVVKILLDYKAEINAKGGDYGSALQAASYCKSSD